MGETSHSMVLQALLMALGIRAKAWGICVLPVHRVEVGEGRWHRPDLCVVAQDGPLREALRLPPLLCVEIVSPEDGLSAMHEKIADYIAAGVKIVWLIDPRLKKVYETLDGHNVTSTVELTVPGTDILILTGEIFDTLDELHPNEYLATAFHEKV